MAETNKHKRKERIGRVVSAKMQKTVIVENVVRKQHPLYKKYVNKTVRFCAHDETNMCKEGDVVRIVETRPLSKRKRWRVCEVFSKELSET